MAKYLTDNLFIWSHWIRPFSVDIKLLVRKSIECLYWYFESQLLHLPNAQALVQRIHSLPSSAYL